LLIGIIARIDVTNVVGRTNARLDGIVARNKGLSAKTSVTVNRKRSAMAYEATEKRISLFIQEGVGRHQICGFTSG
jgi:hypothetical protein